MDLMLKRKCFIFSAALLVVYLLGVTALSRLQGVHWDIVPVFWVGIIQSPLWVKIISAVTILAGTMLIYFIPGIFIAKHFSRDGESSTEMFLKGFLINYFYYYLLSTLCKAAFHQEFSREVMVVLMGSGILTMGLIFLLSRKSAIQLQEKFLVPTAHDLKFMVFYAIFLIGVFSIFYKKIFFSHFGGDGDGVEQYWLAYSVKSGILPTSFRTLYTLIPQFSFAPSVYLNMFALTLFGDAEFIIKIEILVAFIGLGFILKELIAIMCKGRKWEAKELVPLLLYLLLFFIIISYRAAYIPPTDLAKSNETLQLVLFLSGFYLLAKHKKDKALQAAVFFVLAAMIRYNGMFMITIFLMVFSILFKKYKCLLWYLSGLILVFLLLNLLLISSPFKFGDMVADYWDDVFGLSLSNQRFDLYFVLAYLKNYFVLTAGLSIFLILGFKNKYVLMMLLTSVVYLALPLGSICVPAHFFVPILMFPLVSYYLWK